eukprot:273333-Pyramimonas_sp.AAC.1
MGPAVAARLPVGGEGPQLRGQLADHQHHVLPVLALAFEGGRLARPKDTRSLPTARRCSRPRQKASLAADLQPA